MKYMQSLHTSQGVFSKSLSGVGLYTVKNHNISGLSRIACQTNFKTINGPYEKVMRIMDDHESKKTIHRFTRIHRYSFHHNITKNKNTYVFPPIPLSSPRCGKRLMVDECEKVESMKPSDCPGDLKDQKPKQIIIFSYYGTTNTNTK